VRELSGKMITQIAAGWNHSIALTEAGFVYTCGYGFFGQLGLGDDESRTSFTHVSALGQFNVDRIYSGGNHSWALINMDEPRREVYDPPSPLATDIGNVSRDATPTKGGVHGAFDKRPHYALQLVYSDVACCHRFIRFTLKESSLE
jgi:hypothetical protein